MSVRYPLYIRYNFRPDKYADEVQFLNHVLDFFIIDQADFWCSKILPWAKTDSLHFQWNVWSKTILRVLNPYVYDYHIPSCLPLYTRCLSVTQSSTAPSRTSSECLGFVFGFRLGVVAHARTMAHIFSPSSLSDPIKVCRAS